MFACTFTVIAFHPITVIVLSGVDGAAEKCFFDRLTHTKKSPATCSGETC